MPKDNKKKKVVRKDLPLGEDYQESGLKYEFSSDKAREEARRLSSKKKEQ